MLTDLQKRFLKTFLKTFVSGFAAGLLIWLLIFRFVALEDGTGKSIALVYLVEAQKGDLAVLKYPFISSPYTYAVVKETYEDKLEVEVGERETALVLEDLVLGKVLFKF